jgi:hypothetical protein
MHEQHVLDLCGVVLVEAGALAEELDTLDECFLVGHVVALAITPSRLSMSVNVASFALVT